MQSNLGEGSTFTITLPDRTGEAGSCAPASVPRVAEAPAGAATILVVDDDPAVLDLLSITLGKQGLVAFDQHKLTKAGESWERTLRGAYLPSLAGHVVDPLGCGDAVGPARS